MYSVSSTGMISLNGAPAVLLSSAEDSNFKSKVIDRWTNLSAKYSSKYGVPVAWILAIIYAESLGNPNAVNSEVPPGLGLMQITDPGLKRGLSNAQVLIPDTNLDIGVSFIKRIITLGNHDLVKVASYYNCGGRSDGSPHTAPTSGQNPAWGYCATVGYLERVTQASNTYLAKYSGTPSRNIWRDVGKTAVGLALLAYAGRRLFS